MFDLFAKPEPRTPRKHQRQSIDRLRQSLARGCSRPCLQLPTGAGKTFVASMIVNGALAKGNRVVFTVPALSLINQTVEAFEAEGVTQIGVIQADHPRTDWTAPVQVASVQTLARRDRPDCEVVVVDECHIGSKVISEWMAECPDVPFIGLSATPWRQGMSSEYDDLIIGATMQELIDAGFLSSFRVFAPAHPDLSGVKTTAGDFNQGQLGEVMGEGQMVADVVSTWLEKGEARPTLCFAVDRAHAKKLQADFERSGVPTGYVDAYTDEVERALVARRFERGEIKVVCNVGCLTTGVDWDVRCIILARPTKSEMLYVQMIGRGLRTADGKNDCLASGTQILTQRGPVPIEKVLLSDKLWDGQQWVSHQGVISKGKRHVITYQGLTGTPDHKVWTEKGWRTLGECEREKIAIIQTGLGGREIRLRPGDLPGTGVEGQAWGAPDICSNPLRWVWSRAVNLSRKFGAWAHERLSILQSACAFPKVALSADAGCGAALLQSEQRSFCGLWGQRRYFRFFFSGGSGALGSVEPWFAGKPESSGDRQNRQRQGLCAGESSLVHSAAQQAQSAITVDGKHASLSKRVSGSQVCGRYVEADDWVGNDRSADIRAVGKAFGETEREVWDILNAGPRNCFTAEGLLVHNCLILDHADNTLRLGFVTDIHHTRLKGGKREERAARERQEPLPKECTACGYVKPAKVAKCPSCGFKPERQSDVEMGDGELIEVRGAKHQPTKQEKQDFWSGLLWVANERGRKKGWASHAYKEKFKVWPRGLDDNPRRPSQEVKNWVKAKDIRFAKSKQRQEVRRAAT